jgi:hypothetical protein
MEYHAERFARRLQREAPDGPAARVRRAYALAFARPPADEEVAFAERFVGKHGLAQFCLALLNANEFLYVG